MQVRYECYATTDTKKKSHSGGEVGGQWNVFSCLLSRIPYYCVITQYSFIKINGGDRSGMFLAVCNHIFRVITLYSLTKINGGDRLRMFLAVCYHMFLISVFYTLVLLKMTDFLNPFFSSLYVFS